MNSVRRFVNMGFTEEDAIQAVHLYGNESAALSYLLEKAPAKPVEPLNPTERQRSQGTPVGLLNVGNTCYFNGLIQSYFMLPFFYQQIMTIQSSNLLVVKFQRLFGLLAASCRKYVNPTMILEELKDFSGNPVITGDQKDIGEFNLIIIDGLTKAIEPNPVTSSMFMTQSGVQIEETPISSIFYGLQWQSVKSKEADGTPVQLKSQIMVGQIMLDIKHKELYVAWENAFNALVDDFVTPKGHTNSAFLSLSFKKLPKMLTFQLNRVVYRENSLRKLHDKFQFPDILYPDRFLFENKKRKRIARQRHIELINQYKALDEQLQDLKMHKGNEMVEILSGCQEILSKIANMKLQCDIKENKMNEARETLRTIENHMNNQITQIENSMKAIEEEIKSIYDAPNFTQHKYFLHSILVHDGEADGGHYFCFIYDRHLNLWWKFNDILVSEATEEQVFRQSVGGHGKCSAYGLTYVSEEMLMKEVSIPIHNRDIGVSTADFYGMTMPSYLHSFIEKHNEDERNEVFQHFSNN